MKRWIREASWLQRIWDDNRIIVNGLITQAKLDYIAKRSLKWPGA